MYVDRVYEQALTATYHGGPKCPKNVQFVLFSNQRFDTLFGQFQFQLRIKVENIRRK